MVLDSTVLRENIYMQYVNAIFTPTVFGEIPNVQLDNGSVRLLYIPNITAVVHDNFSSGVVI